MFEIIIWLYVLVATGVFVWGIATNTPAIVGLSGVLFLLFGTMLWGGEPIQKENGFIITEVDSTTTNVDKNYTNVTAQNDSAVNVLAQLFTYGGIVLVIIAIAMYWRGRTANLEG